MWNKLTTSIWRFLKDEDGPTAVEYAVMLMMIFLACIAMIQVIGVSTSSSFSASNDAIANAIDGAQGSSS